MSLIIRAQYGVSILGLLLGAYILFDGGLRHAGLASIDFLLACWAALVARYNQRHARREPRR